MALSRRILLRLTVAFLAISLSSQLLQGQELRCAEMNGAMSSTHMQHSHDVTAVSSHDKQSQQNSQSSSCLLGTLCLNAPAILVSHPVFVDNAPAAAGITFGAVKPDARSLRPDSPPPKI
jgi:hypothetical protein